jgi:hypothetical protein
VEEQFRSSKLRRTIDWEMPVSPHHDGKWEAYIYILAAKLTHGDDTRHKDEKKVRLPPPKTRSILQSLT